VRHGKDDPVQTFESLSTSLPEALAACFDSDATTTITRAGKIQIIVY
jgi:hypothetical protein